MLKNTLDTLMRQNPFARLGDCVYQVLYEAIIELDLPPGTVLSETALARELDISRTPIRSAFIRLAKNGLLENSYRHTFAVTGFKKEESRQLMEARIPVEAQAACHAAERISSGHIAALENHLKAFSVAFDAWNIREMVVADNNFHQTIIDAACNRFLSELYRQLAPRVIHYRYFLYNKTPKEQLVPIMGASLRIHRSIYNAVRLGFANEAKSCMERDIAGMTGIIGLWQE